MTSTCKCNNQYEQFNEKGNRLHRCPACYARQGRRNKRKGKAKEKDVEKLLLSVVGGVIRRTPGSGAMANFSGDDWAGDLWFKDNFLADDKVVAEIKHGYSSFSKKWIEQANELGDWGIVPKFFIWWTPKHSRVSVVVIPFAWYDYLFPLKSIGATKIDSSILLPGSVLPIELVEAIKDIKRISLFSQLNWSDGRFPKEALLGVVVWHPRGYIPLVAMPHKTFLSILKNYKHG